jgi:hypothetical protein
MTWTLQRIEETPEGLWPMTREIASNDQGASIEPWGSTLAGRQVLFKYNHQDIAFEFQARRSPRCDAQHGELVDTDSNFPLGPVCEVWIDDRPMRFGGHRPLAAAEWETVKWNITEFLTTTFNLCRLSAAPYAEQIEFS